MLPKSAERDKNGEKRKTPANLLCIFDFNEQANFCSVFLACFLHDDYDSYFVSFPSLTFALKQASKILETSERSRGLHR